MTSVETLMQAEIERLREQNASQSVHIIAQGGEIEGLRAENDTLRGAMAANDERLRVAGERVGIIAGCDTAELMADEIECLLAEVAALRAEVANLTKIIDEAWGEA